MATGSYSNASVGAPAEHERFIERQINATRRQVKRVEISVALVTLVVGLLAFFLVTSLVDHWIMPLGYWGRALALLVLIGGAIWYLAVVLWPLLRNSINPAYAALTIEQTAPMLKNSLINFLLLRGQRSDVHDVVYEAVEARAANDLRQVPLDTVIDYSKLIRIGYVLAGLFAVLAAYKVFSPKDPLQTVARVVAPWADIARPSRVQIEEVAPGDVEMYFGESLTITATIRGARSNDPVRVIYSTVDGQLVDQVVDMKLDERGLSYGATLPVDGRGVQQDLIYRLEAGDALTRDYKVRVLAAPTIVVQKIEYDFPRYTQKPTQTVENTGEIRALEGTKVTLHAQANQPIQAAYIEFDPRANDDSPEATLRRVRIPMTASGQAATGSFVLELAGDRTTPKFSTYQVTFMTEGGVSGLNPVLHTIDVVRDLPPEIEILTPAETTVSVPVNGQQAIEVRAVDADFALSRVSLKLTSSGRDLAEELLLNSNAGHAGQWVNKFKLRPRDYNLQPGDEVVLWAVAADNRTAARSGLGEPNTQRTKNYTIKITAPDARAEQKAAEENAADQEAGRNEEQPGEQKQDGSQKTESGQGGKSNTGEGSSEQSEGGNSEQPMSGGENSDKNQQQNNQDQNSDGSSQEKQDGQGNKGNNSGSGGEEGNQEQQPNQDPMNNKGQQAGKTQQGDKQGENNSESQSKKQDQNSSKTNKQSKGAQGASGNEEPGKEEQNNSESTDEGATNGAAGGEAGKSDSPMNGGSGQSGKNDNSQQNQGAGKQPGQKSEGSGKPNNQGGSQPNNGGSNEQANGTPNGDNNTGDRSSSPQQRGQQPGKSSQGSGGQKQGTGGEQTPPGEREKAHEGEAIEKALERLMNQAKEQQSGGDKQEGAQEQAGNKTGDESGNGGESAQISDELAEKVREFQKKQDQQKQGGNANGQQEGKQEGAPTGQSEGNHQQGKPQHKEGTNADKKQGSGANNQRGAGETGKPDDKAKTQPEQKGGDDEKSGKQSDGGLGSNGQSGSGRDSQDKTGSAEAQEKNQDRNKQSRPDQQKGADEEGAQSPSGSKKQSDSQGAEGGSQSGGGKKGGGQPSNAAGNDSAGSNSAADEGAGAAQEKGMGETGNNGGDQQQANQRTGQSSGTEEGVGSQSQADPNGDKADAPNKFKGEDAKEQGGQKPDRPPQGTAEGQQAGGNGPVTGGGQAGATGGESPLKDAEGPAAEKAKIDYAREATDLVLDYLKDQKDQPDQQLLDELGWTKEDMQQFLSRWEAAKKEAVSSKKAKGELDEALRSLGLRPQNDKLRRGDVKSDNVRGLGDVGPQSAPPSKYLDQFRAFKKGAARGK